MRRRYLHQFAGKLSCSIMYKFFRDPFNRCKIAWLTFKVISRCGCTEGKCTGVLLFLCHVFIDALCKLAGADDEQTSGKRVKCTGMSNFFYTHEVTDLVHGIKRCPF